MSVKRPGRNGRAGGKEGHVGPFVTFVERRRPDGLVARWESRHFRKHLEAASSDGSTVGSTYWAPRARGWWIAVLFAVGSSFFAVGAVPGYVGAVGTSWDAVTFFVGSLFFTSAGFLTYREAVDAAAPASGVSRRRFLVIQPGRIDWWATAVQLAGTLFFNVSCGNALRANLTAEVANQHVWRPDALGSICFLVASTLAWFEVCHGWVAWRPRSWSWWITGVNLAGSVAFALSAVAAYIDPVTGEVNNADRSAWLTFVGAVCFFVGALLLLPERTEPEHTEPERTEPERTEPKVQRTAEGQASMMTGMINGLRRYFRRAQVATASRTSSSVCSMSMPSFEAFVRIFWITGTTVSNVRASCSKPCARKSGFSTILPVSGFTMATIVTTPSSAMFRRTFKEYSVTPPTVVPSTKTRPAGTFPVMAARPLTRSMTDPSSAMITRSGWTPVRIARSALGVALLE